MPHEAPIEKGKDLCYNRDRSKKWKMIHRGAQAAFYRSDFPKRRSPRRTRSRGDLPRDFPFGERVSAAKSARKTDDFPKRLLSPDGTRARDNRVPTHRMLRAALKRPFFNFLITFTKSQHIECCVRHGTTKKHLSYKGRCFSYAEIIVSAAPSPDTRAGRRCRRARRR